MLNYLLASNKEFEAVFSGYYTKLCRQAFFYLRSKEDAEDVVQELFIKLWHDRPELFKDEATIVPYLYTAARNNSISVLRKRFIAVSVDDEEVSQSISQLSDVEETDHHEELHQQVMNAIEQLPPKCSEVFKMHRLLGLSYKQIAEELGISVKTVENQIGKALRVIRESVPMPQTA